MSLGRNTKKWGVGRGFLHDSRCLGTFIVGGNKPGEREEAGMYVRESPEQEEENKSQSSRPGSSSGPPWPPSQTGKAGGFHVVAGRESSCPIASVVSVQNSRAWGWATVKSLVAPVQSSPSHPTEGNCTQCPELSVFLFWLFRSCPDSRCSLSNVRCLHF